MSQIINRSFNAEPKELVPSKGINDIQDNIIKTSFDLWSLADLLKEGSAEFATMLFTDAFDVDKSLQSSNVQFYYDNDFNISRVVLGENKVIDFTYSNGLISKAILTYYKGDFTFSKTYLFTYDDNDNIVSVNIE